MRWEKLGQIYDVQQHPVAYGSGGFAQSPQALVCDDHIRIYFSTRSQDAGGFKSHVAFVNMTLNLDRVLGVSERPVMDLGSLGCFDEHGIFPLSVLRHGKLVYGYTTGWSRRVSTSVETGIGLAVSQDGGLTFARQGAGPVLSASLREPFLVADGYVRVIDGLFHMWYIFGTAWSSPSDAAAPERVYKIGHATSPDGVAWTKDEGRQIIPDRLGAQECQALPCVFDVGGRMHMVFCFREQVDFRTGPGRGYRLGHAWSDDLVEWVRDDGALPLHGEAGAWDGEMQCYPNVFHSDGTTYLLYNGNAFGRHGFGAARLVV
jgi:hypothetical protein